MFNRLEEVESRYEELTALLVKPEVISRVDLFREYGKEHSQLVDIVDKYRDLKRTIKKIDGNKNFLRDKDPEIRQIAEEEIGILAEHKEQLEQTLKLLLLPKDPNDEKNVLLEIRAGTGGDESALFVADLFRMYIRYAEIRHWKCEVLSSHPIGIGGFKEIILLIVGKNVYSTLKYEGGVHRVQRVPETETQGRIHTSAITVAVLPEAEDVDVKIDENDLVIDVFRSSGPGGQSVNTTDSAVRITHKPSGIVVTCQDEKSQHKNRAKALKVLRARILEEEENKQRLQIADNRKAMVGSGDRSERIRTYNYPQGRVSDHRIGLTLYKLSAILEGNLEDLIVPLRLHYQALSLQGKND